ncbi:MAG: hypothetical protein OXJ37_01370 [Bryobacterales bacterium]|nr:hypothetical protein [Bryobacterales bacterium]
MKLNFHDANTSSRFRSSLAVAALTSLAALPGQADALGAKSGTACSALSDRAVHEYTILSATDFEAAGGVVGC